LGGQRDITFQKWEVEMVTTITVVSHGKSMTAELYTPTGTPVNGLIVIAYGSDGLTDNLSGPWATMIKGYAVSLAEKGFTALIPDYLKITNTKPGPGVFAMIPQSRNDWQRAISDAIGHAMTLSKIDPGRVGLLGFSLGGHLCLRLRAKAKVLVEFFAPVLDGIGSPGTLTHAQIHHGKADHVPGTAFPNAGIIADTLKHEGTSTELFPYPGAGHGFIGGDKDNTSARDLSKVRTLSFFQAHL
jgi:dienelactone hydrolase